MIILINYARTLGPKSRHYQDVCTYTSNAFQNATPMHNSCTPFNACSPTAVKLLIQFIVVSTTGFTVPLDLLELLLWILDAILLRLIDRSQFNEDDKELLVCFSVLEHVSERVCSSQPKTSTSAPAHREEKSSKQPHTPLGGEHRG